MTRKSRREIERAVDDLDDGDDDLGRPFSTAERERLLDAGVDADAWGQTRQRRAILRGLRQAARGAST